MATKKRAKTNPKQSLGIVTRDGILVVEPMKMRIADLNLAAYNPRKISREKMASLKASIYKYGLVLTLVVQLKENVVIGGHQRLRAMQELCEEHGWKMPEHCFAQVMDVDDATAKQLNITLNNVEGEFDPFKLGVLVAEILPDMKQDDILATGFTHEHLQELVQLSSDEDAPGGGDVRTFGKSLTLSCSFDKVEDRDRAKKLLDAIVARTGEKSGAIIMRALRGVNATKK